MSHDAAIEALARGFMIGVPTDTVYGLAIDPANAEAVQRLFNLKGRGDGAPLVVLAATLDQISTFARLPESIDLTGYWPGALTAVLTARAPLVAGVGDPERQTVGVRIPDHAALSELLEIVGPLAVTSANRTGEAPALDSEHAAQIFGAEVPIYLPGVCAGGTASTVADFTVNPPVVLRAGPVSL
jgi:tRNA threonylcarbamoyl adenosine modification protein (Sua5/YciO/YrdC/YwlC family)